MAQTSVELFGSICVAPRKMTKFIVGIYEKGFPEPQLNVMSDRLEAISYKLNKLEDKGEFTLVYSIENYSDATVQVVIEGYESKLEETQ